MPINLHGDFHTERLVPLARELRTKPTDAERALWRLLRQRPAGAKFRRQHPIGNYILDFFCVERRLAVEGDGGEHLTPEGVATDEVRTRELNARGIRMLRFTNREILLESNGVLQAILEVLGSY